MKRLLTAAQMREADRRTIEEVGIPGLILMENAGLGVAQLSASVLEEDAASRILIICGKGNNGGDGFVSARHLINQGFDVTVCLVGDADSLKGDALQNYRMLVGMAVPVLPIQHVAQLDKLPEPDLIVDALLGTGVTGTVTGLMAEIIQWINRQPCSVLSVDLPSGLQSDSGRFEGACVLADKTATMAELKLGLVLPPGRDLAGEITVIDIGSPPSAASLPDVHTHLLEPEDVFDALPPRPSEGHKGTFGKVFVLAGSTGMTGAATLCSLATLRAGAGLTMLGIPKSLNPILESNCTEVITKPLAETESGSLSLEAESAIDEWTDWADILIVGPGLSLHPDTVALVRKVVQKDKLPLVLDADGINALAGESDLLKKHKKPVIITPHPGELAKLTGRSIAEISADPVSAAREAAQAFHCVCVLKGSPTVIASPDGEMLVNPTGNSGLGTGGTGDVLTGVIGGLLAQLPHPFESAYAGVYLHGLAGNLTAETLGERSLIASDLLDFLPHAFLTIERAS